MLKFEDFKEKLTEDMYISLYKDVLEVNDLNYSLITL